MCKVLKRLVRWFCLKVCERVEEELWEEEFRSSPEEDGPYSGFGVETGSYIYDPTDWQ